MLEKPSSADIGLSLRSISLNYKLRYAFQNLNPIPHSYEKTISYLPTLNLDKHIARQGLILHAIVVIVPISRIMIEQYTLDTSKFIWGAEVKDTVAFRIFV